MNSIRIIFFTFLALGAFSAQPQHLSYGARLSFGTGTINSSRLQDYFDFAKADDPDIKKYNLNAKLGTVFSIGGFVEYPLNSNLSLIGELSFQQQSSNLQIDLMEDDSQSGLTFRDQVESNNQIKISSVNIPLLARYYLQGKAGPYITSGLGLDMVLSSKIVAEENILKQDVDLSGTFTTKDAETRVNEADFDGFSSPRLAFTLGAGTVLDAGPAGITVDLKYSLGLTKSEVFTNDVIFDDQTKESDVFGVFKQADLALNDGFLLDDFKTGSLLITIGYKF